MNDTFKEIQISEITLSKIIGLVKSRKDLPNWSVGFTCCSIFWLRLLIPDIFAVMAVDFRRQSKSSDDFHLTTRDSDDPMKRHLANIREWQLFFDLRWKATFRIRMNAAKQNRWSTKISKEESMNLAHLASVCMGYGYGIYFVVCGSVVRQHTRQQKNQGVFTRVRICRLKPTAGSSCSRSIFFVPTRSIGILRIAGTECLL